MDMMVSFMSRWKRNFIFKMSVIQIDGKIVEKYFRTTQKDCALAIVSLQLKREKEYFERLKLKDKVGLP